MIQGNSSYGALNVNDATIKTLTNSGTISNNSNQGVNIADGATIETFNNSGTIKGANSGIFVSSNIKTLKNSGTIIANGNQETDAGIKLESGGTIDNIINTGTISSNASGIAVSYGKFGTLFIKDGGIVYGKESGIEVGQWQRLGDLYINGGKNSKKDATVSGVYGGKYGIYLGIGSSTQKIELSNGGVIQGGINGIRLRNSASLSGDMVLSGEGSMVKGGSGAAISNESGKISGSITIKDGATIGSDSGKAIENSGSGTVTGGITISGSNTKIEGDIVNTDNGSIGGDIKIERGAQVEGGITNTGNGSITGSIVVEEGGKLDSITNTSTSDTGISGSITNNSDNNLEISNGEGATIGSGIINSSTGTIFVNNQGTIDKDSSGNNLTNNGSGSIVIEDWLVTSDESGNLDTIVVGGNGSGNVSADNITIDEANLDLDNLDDISDVISGIDKGNVSNITTNGSGDINLIYDPTTGKIYQSFNLNASISGATFRSLVSTTTRRSTFIDNVMGNSMQSFYLSSSSRAQRMAMQEKGNLYSDASDYIKSDFKNASYGMNKEHSLFILPYTSSQNVELSLNEESKGHTKGTIIGYSTLKDSG
ncbi:hypothetical protein GQV94_07540, partial [Campylobacter sp. TTU_617]|nr:hypothetical protein [Campylobacter sp. TTU_617]